MIDKTQILEELLEAMIADDQDITARAVCRRSDGVFKHATDITRNDARHGLVKTSIMKQEAIRAAVNRTSKKSRVTLERMVATKNAEIEQLNSDKDLLIASHRAMILSVAEMGGFATWKRFFDQYQATIDRLENIGALPEVNVISLSTRKDT